MKKIGLILVLVSFLSSCGLQNIPGDVAVSNVLTKVKSSKKLSDEEFVKTKLQVGNYLNLSQEVKESLAKHFKNEKEELNKVEDFQEEELARIIIKYETNFRVFLNKEQLSIYKQLRKRFDDIYFYSEYSTDILKKRYFRLNR